MSAILLRLSAVGLITAMSAVVHGLAQTVPVGQIMFWRSCVALVPILLYLRIRGPVLQGLRTRRPWAHLTRSAFGCLSMGLSFVSLAYLPVANASALSYLAPLITIPMAAALLKERIGAVVIGAGVLGFVGVVTMLWGSLRFSGLADTALIGVLAGFGYALTMGFVRVHVKGMLSTETPASVAFYFALVCSAVGAITAFWGWAPLDIEILGWLILAGLLGGASHIAGVEAVARSSVATLAPFDYSGMIWALGFDIWIFGVIPDGLSVTGMLAIVAAALMVAWADIRRSAVGPQRP